MTKENYADILKQDLKTSARELKAWSQMDLLSGHWAQVYFQSCGRMVLEKQSQGIGVPIKTPTLTQ